MGTVSNQELRVQRKQVTKLLMRCHVISVLSALPGEAQGPHILGANQELS